MRPTPPSPEAQVSVACAGTLEIADAGRVAARKGATVRLRQRTFVARPTGPAKGQPGQPARAFLRLTEKRSKAEFDTAHLPYARSMPLAEMAQRLAELPQEIEIVAYCRGPFCLMSDAAVTLLRARLPGLHDN